MVEGGWNIADCVSRSYDLEGMQVGTVAAGRIGSAVLRRLKPFEVGLHYTDRHRLPAEVEEELGVTFHPTVESLVAVCDVVTINAPLHPETEHMFNDELIGEDEARRLPRQHRARQDLRPRRRRPRTRERAARRLRRRRLVPAAGAQGPPVADDAPPRHDAAHLGHGIDRFTNPLYFCSGYFFFYLFGLPVHFITDDSAGNTSNYSSDNCTKSIFFYFLHYFQSLLRLLHHLQRHCNALILVTGFLYCFAAGHHQYYCCCG